MDILFSRETGFQLANTAVQNFITGYGIQPLIAKETPTTPVISPYSFLPYIIITDNLV